MSIRLRFIRIFIILRAHFGRNDAFLIRCDTQGILASRKA